MNYNTPNYHIIDEDKTKIKTKIFKCPGVTISKNIFEPGYYMITDYKVSDYIKNSGTKHFILSGSYTETTGTISEKLAGWKSWESDDFHPAGTWRRESPNGCLLWCAWGNSPNTRIDYVTCKYLQKNETHTIPNNSYLFCATGGLTLDSSKVLELEKLYNITTGDKLITANEDSYFFYWSNSVPLP